MHTCRIEKRPLPRRGKGPADEYQVSCSCGWHSDWTLVAGMAHGAEAAHKEAIDALSMAARTFMVTTPEPVSPNVIGATLGAVVGFGVTVEPVA